MRGHCSIIVKFLAYAIFNGAGFGVINVIKKKKKKTSFSICNP